MSWFRRLDERQHKTNTTINRQCRAIWWCKCSFWHHRWPSNISRHGRGDTAVWTHHHGRPTDRDQLKKEKNIGEVGNKTKLLPGRIQPSHLQRREITFLSFFDHLNISYGFSRNGRKKAWPASPPCSAPPAPVIFIACEVSFAYLRCSEMLSTRFRLVLSFMVSDSSFVRRGAPPRRSHVSFWGCRTLSRFPNQNRFVEFPAGVYATAILSFHWDFLFYSVSFRPSDETGNFSFAPSAELLPLFSACCRVVWRLIAPKRKFEIKNITHRPR